MLTYMYACNMYSCMKNFGDVAVSYSIATAEHIYQSYDRVNTESTVLTDCQFHAYTVIRQKATFMCVCVCVCDGGVDASICAFTEKGFDINRYIYIYIYIYIKKRQTSYSLSLSLSLSDSLSLFLSLSLSLSLTHTHAHERTQS